MNRALLSLALVKLVLRFAVPHIRPPPRNAREMLLGLGGAALAGPLTATVPGRAGDRAVRPA